MKIRTLRREELGQIWNIDRSEVIERLYTLQDGELVLHEEYYDVKGWPPGEAEKYTPLHEASFDRGATFFGAFDEERLVGVSVLDSRWLGPGRNLLQLEMLHVSHAYRGQGFGRALFEKARELAREQGAAGLYISATPSEHTIHFYQSFGATPIPEPDAELFALEPEDIHLVCAV